MGRHRLAKLIFAGFVGTDVATYGIDRRSVPLTYGLRIGRVYLVVRARVGPPGDIVSEYGGQEQFRGSFL